MIYFNQPEVFNKKFEIVACFLERNGKFVLLHRQDHKSEGDTWGLPAGKVDQGEDKLDAMEREIREETGFIVGDDKPKLFKTLYVKYPDYDFVYNMYYLNIKDDFDVKIEINEHKDFTWVTPRAALEKNLIRDLDACIRLYYDIC